ncbi:MAG TPA: MarR family transcriptional regulator [Armatimonadota bacterium]|nr:MarR family transcriptional regulator [Armatimonadota bacterium]
MGCGKSQGQLERLVELLGTYSSSVLIGRLLDETTDGEITPAQFDALAFIERHGGCSAKTLSEGLRISIPSSTRLVDRLVRKNLVNRCESGVDRRLLNLTVTAEGESALRAVREAHITRLQHALESFEPAEREALLKLLERFLQASLSDIETVEDCCLRCGAEHDGACVVNEAHIALVGRPIEHP